MRNDDTPNDPGHDRWLQAALRHAPDADAAPPPALSAAILRQARAAAAPALPSFGQRLIDAWAWLVSPPVATGLASLMVLTVAGLMWWDRPLDEARPLPDAPVTVAQAPAAQPAPATAPAAESVAAPQAAVPVNSPAPAPAAAPPVAAKAAAPPEPRRELEGLGTARRVLPGAPKAPTALADAEADAAQESVARPAPPAPVAAAGRATHTTADTAVEAAAADPAAASPERRAAMQRGLASAASDTAPRARALAARPDPAPGSVQPLRELRFAAAQHPDLWRWQRGAEPARSVDAATLTWLDQLDQSAPWRPASAPAPDADAATTLLSWYRNGQLYARLQLQAGTARYELQRNPAARWQAELSAEQMAALLGALDTALK